MNRPVLEPGENPRNLVQGELGRQPVVLPHRLIGNRHDLPEHLRRLVVHSDVVAERLGHLVHTVGTDQQGNRHNHLRSLIELTHEVASHEEVPQLIGATKLDVRIDGHRIHPLEQRIHELRH